MGLNPSALPKFPWDSLTPVIERARAHPDGAIMLSVGTPVDSTPEIIRQALADAADAPGYPTTQGTRELRQAAVDWFARCRAVPGMTTEAVIPTVGSKEMVALLPSLLGLGPEDVVVLPEVAYPTYDVGARLVGARRLATDDVASWRGDSSVALVWVNSPSNPTGAVASVEDLREIVTAARDIGAAVVADECYAELPWTVDEAPSILDPRVCGGDHSGLLVLYSLSKRSNLAGYRAGLLAGDDALVARILEVRKHAGLIVPGPVQAAMEAALGDDDHVAVQRRRYQARRTSLKAALEHAGLAIEHSAAGLYLWATRGEDCWETVNWLAERGIVAAPGAFYGEAGTRHVRIGLTASDAHIAEAVRRLTEND